MTSRRPILLAGIIALVLIAGGLGAYALNRPKPAGQSLIPKFELKVGDNRYVSPCQALPEKDVAASFGKFGRDGYINETYQDRSVDANWLRDHADAGSIDSSCVYHLENAGSTDVTVTMQQFASAKDAQDSWRTAANLGDGTYEKQLTDFKQALARDQAAGKTSAAQDQSAQQLIQFMEETLPKAQKEAGTAVDGLDKSILFVKERSEFEAVYGNVVVSIGYQSGSDNPFDPARMISSTELGSILGPIKQSFDTVFANMANKQLSQAPSPTIRTAGTKVGPTRILEPCELLDQPTFAAIFGQPNNDPLVERQTTGLDLQADRTHQNGYPILPDNDCVRRFSSSLATTKPKDVDSGYVDLQLAYAKSPQAARAHMDGELAHLDTNGPGDIRVVKSHADYTKIRTTNKGILVQNIRFQKGNYTGTLTIAKTNADGDDITISDADLIAGVNAIVDKL